jgi:sulfite reductase (NADPH) hemoprotein beta-component
MAERALSANERIKEASEYLRGTLAEGLRDGVTGAIVEDDQQLVKFHGMYLQDDRDLRAERAKKKMEKAFSFMIRVRIPGGVSTPQQWLMLDRVARQYGNGSVRLTTRQSVQLHGVIKSNLKTTMKAIDDAVMATIAACGDVNRNVMCNPNPFQSRAHAAALELAQRITDHLTPRTGAYREVWLDGERIAGRGDEPVEPIYGKTYLPRKFKIAVAVPPSNDVDVYAQDLSFIAIMGPDGNVLGWNVAAGGGMGMTHGEPDTYPRTADILGFCKTRDVLAIAEAVVTVQRDWGDRSNRKHARLKYTIEDHGLAAFRSEVERRASVSLEEARPVTFTSTGDRYGWTESEGGHAHLTLFIENGRVLDAPGKTQLTGLRRIAEVHGGDFRLTANQNLIVANVAPDKRAEIARIAAEHGLTGPLSGLKRNSMACVALPTCGLALAESERYMPTLVAALEQRLAAHGLADDDIVIRMTGCPNGCARPYISEIGVVGKGPGRYNLYLGAAFDGSRMSKLYAEDLDHDGIVAGLDPLFAAYAAERRPDGLCRGDQQRTRLPRQHRRKAVRMNARTPIAARTSRMEALARLPVFFALDGKRAIVAGGTPAAAWKAELLSAAGARVEVYVVGACEELLAEAAEGRPGTITIHGRDWQDTDFVGAAIAVGACETDDDAARFAAAARQAGVPVNVIDKPRFCDFSFGAIVNRSPLVIGISTDCAAPVFGQAIRAKLEALLPRGFSGWAEAAKRWRRAIQDSGLSFNGRRQFWRTFTAFAMNHPDRTPEPSDYDRLFAETAAGATAAASGFVSLVGTGPGDPELLTLRAVRALQSADVILFDQQMSPAILEFARREARTMLVGSSQGEIEVLTIGLAKTGRRVVQLMHGNPAADEAVTACRKASVPVEVVPGIATATATPIVFADDDRPAALSG